jgi:hypothetical protein
MEQKLVMMLQYEVCENFFATYHKTISHIFSSLSYYDVLEYELFHYEGETYVEKLIVPTESHYLSLKKLRTSKDHEIFGQLDPLIKGGVENMRIFAIK